MLYTAVPSDLTGATGTIGEHVLLLYDVFYHIVSFHILITFAAFSVMDTRVQLF